MRVYTNLEAISEARVTDIMQNHIFAWSGDPNKKKGTWLELLKDFERNRTNRHNTESIYRSIPFEERCAFTYVVTRIITDWDRLSFSHLYLLCCQQWNCLCEFLAIDIINDLNNLNSNSKTIEYACNVDLENIEDLYNAGDTDGLRKLLYYSEDCDEPEYQCSYKTKAENKIGRCLDRLEHSSKTNSTQYTTSPKNNTTDNVLTNAFKQERAIKVLQSAIESGYLDDRYNWIGETCGERAYFAYKFCSEIIHDGYIYDKLFTEFWGCRNMTSDLSKFRERSQENKLKEYERKLKIDALFT